MNTDTRAAGRKKAWQDQSRWIRARTWTFVCAALAMAALPTIGRAARPAETVTPPSHAATPITTQAEARAHAQAGGRALTEAQGPRLTNADERRVAASGPLEAQIRSLAQQQEPFWIAMIQPSARPGMDACCYSNNGGSWRSGDACCGMCRLERDSDLVIGGSGGDKKSPGASPASSSPASAPPPAAIQLEGSREFIVLARVAQQRVERVRMFSPECALDAGGLRVYTLTGVTPAASVAWLESLVRDEASSASESRETRRRGERLSGGAIAAIAMHRDPAADAALDRLVAPGRPRQQRRDAAFWLAKARGQHGYEVVRTLARDESELELRKHAVFCLTVSENPSAIDELLGLAKHASHPDVRGQALFWVAQTAGKRAEATLTDAIENDPETAVKERAVFALSQLPNKEGTPLLIEVAKTHKNPEVRKKAMFWLGQSKDPRALEFFESILK